MARQQFNTKQFSWTQVDVQIENRVLTGIRGLSYGQSQDKEAIYGKGDMPQAIGRGNVSFQGELTLMQSELETLISNAPNQNLLDYRNLTIQVAYRSDDGQVIVDSLVGVEFTNMDKALRQNDKFMEVNLPILFLSVNYNV